MPYYLFVFDRKKRTVTAGPWSYADGDSARAIERRYQLEADRDDDDREIVLLKGRSLDDLKQSHSHYFASPEGVSGSLRTLTELTEVDRRVRMFSPAGLTPGGQVDPENALVYTQRLLGDVELPKAVPDDLRQHLAVIVNLHRYGYFQYEFFTVATTYAALAWEHVLGALFVRAHNGRVDLARRKGGEHATVEVSGYGEIIAALAPEGEHPYRKGWRLVEDAEFDGSLYALFMWAWRRDLLRAWLDAKWAALGEGVRYSEMTTFGADRRIPDEYEDWDGQRRASWWAAYRKEWEKHYIQNEVALRNTLAHPTHHLVVMPVDSGRAIRQLAEFIKATWS